MLRADGALDRPARVEPEAHADPVVRHAPCKPGVIPVLGQHRVLVDRRDHLDEGHEGHVRHLRNLPLLDPGEAPDLFQMPNGVFG